MQTAPYLQHSCPSVREFCVTKMSTQGRPNRSRVNTSLREKLQSWWVVVDKHPNLHTPLGDNPEAFLQSQLKDASGIGSLSHSSSHCHEHPLYCLPFQLPPHLTEITSLINIPKSLSQICFGAAQDKQRAMIKLELLKNLEFKPEEGRRRRCLSQEPAAELGQIKLATGDYQAQSRSRTQMWWVREMDLPTTFQVIKDQAWEVGS